jgi:hypothetical protein
LLATLMRHLRAAALAVSPLAHRVRRSPVEAQLVLCPAARTLARRAAPEQAVPQ